jgi:hypothetical protein
MFMLTAFEATALGLGLLATVLLLIAGVLSVFPRAGRRVAATVDCPVLGRRAAVDLVRDEWTLRFVDVDDCSLLCGKSGMVCDKECLAASAVRALSRAA